MKRQLLPALLVVTLLPLPVTAVTHTDGWCADAVDFAMGAAQNRELGYSLEMISVSVERNPAHYNRMFAELSVADMKEIVGTVYKQEWTRFGAAQGVTETCTVQ